MSRDWSSGSSPGWRRLRLTVLDRDGWVCQVPVDGGLCLAYADTVGHLDPLVYGGVKLAAPERLRAECRRHNFTAGAVIGNAQKRALGRDRSRGWTW